MCHSVYNSCFVDAVILSRDYTDLVAVFMLNGFLNKKKLIALSYHNTC